MPYLTTNKPRSTSGILAGEPKNQAPFTNPVLPKQAPTSFQQFPGAVITPGTTVPSGLKLLPGLGTTPTTNTAPAAPPTSSLYDATTDPIYQKIQQLGQSQVGQAVAGGDALRKQILIQLGDPTYAASQQFGDPNAPTYGDATTTAAAAANPYSTLAGLANTHTQNNANIDTAANKAGLYYSSTHANQLGDENQNYNQGIVNADNAAGSQLSGIVGQILAAQNNAQSANIGAAGTATDNAISTALAQGYTVTYDPTTGEPVFTPPGGTGSGAGSTGDDGGQSGTTTGGRTPNTTSYTQSGSSRTYAGAPASAGTSPALIAALLGIQPGAGRGGRLVLPTG
jgi:hypothetical protein